ncbi:predicted protein [Naegleria gruberi]|uniref:Predicted protein n=1 Tax=Naegleria gruberi TaxID=5762 RepID=D2VHV7_NAEGR|nr:uncharacterized protein NAEGRDRAFT_49665 [Naegleria gruberi]EFC43658.1 predicted protein [Naegleria gruberi]|eukprot:XP_002676402.1 predicted protein [Naegleria gruberi strain NEG-M]
MIGSKMSSFQSFFMLKARMLYHCKGLDKRYFEKCQKIAYESRGHFRITAFDIMWNESGYRDKTFDLRYDKMNDEFKMGILYENNRKLKSLMKISLMADGHIVAIDLEEYQYSTNSKKYIETMREHFLIAKMSGKHCMIIVNISEFDRTFEKLNDLMEEIQKILKEFSMSNIHIVGIQGNSNFSKLDPFERMPHPLFSKLTCTEAIIEFRKEIVKEIENTQITQNNEGDSLVYAVMGKEKIGGIGTTVIGRVISGSIQFDQEVKITETILSNVKSLEIFHENQTKVNRGDFCGVALKNVRMVDITRGSLIGIDPSHTFEAIVYITHSPKKGWKVGVTPIVFSTCVGEACRVIEIVERLNKKTKTPLVSKPSNCKENELVRLRFSCHKGIQLFSEERWRRIILIHNNKVMGGGFITLVGGTHYNENK